MPIAYPVNVSRTIQAVILLMAMHSPAVAADKDVWQIVFDFQIKLAKQGNAAAQEKVGEMFEEGRGVKQDFAKARFWYHKSASQGHKAAIDKLAGLPARIKLFNASGAGAKEALPNPHQPEPEHIASQKAAREKALRERRAAEREKAARAQALREQQAAERKRAAREQALRERRAAEREQAAREQALRERRAAEREQAARNKTAQEHAGKQRPSTEGNRSGIASGPKSMPDEGQADKSEDSQVFKADPCKSKAARFMSTCKGKK